MTRHRERGAVLLLVLFFALLLTSTIVTLVKHALVDSLIARNREAAAHAEALARGGVQLAGALLVEDRMREGGNPELMMDTYSDLWARAGEVDLVVGAGTIRVRIEDSGARFNLNALFSRGDDGTLVPQRQAEPFLVAMFEKVIDEIDLLPQDKNYEPRELAANLLDYVDEDEVRQRGGDEDEYYQSQTPPYRPANGALMSPDELRLIEGFDGALVDALMPYVTVYPFATGGCKRANVGCGVNLNTAPPHVLALLFFDDGVDLRLTQEDTVRRILRVREEGGLICKTAVKNQSKSGEDCTPISEIVTNAIFPPPTYSSEVFRIESVATVGEVSRSVVAVIDRSDLADLRLLSWRVQ